MRPTRPILLCVLLLAAAAASVAVAAPPYVDIEQRLTEAQRHETGLDTLSPAQLALLNRLLREDGTTVDAGRGEQVAQPPPRQGIGLGLGLATEPIKTHAKGLLAGWAPGSEFELANGQRWKVLKGAVTLRKPRQDPEVTVFPGIAGRWFLRLDEDTPAPRVYRID